MFHGSSQVELPPSPGSYKNLPREPKPNNKPSLTPSQWDVPQFHYPWCRTYTLAYLAAGVFLVVFIWWALPNVRGWKKMGLIIPFPVVHLGMFYKYLRKRKRPWFAMFVNEYGVNNPTMVNFKLPIWVHWTQSRENGHIRSWESIQAGSSIPCSLSPYSGENIFSPDWVFQKLFPHGVAWFLLSLNLCKEYGI